VKKFQVDNIGSALQQFGGFLTRGQRTAVDFQQTITCNRMEYIRITHCEHTDLLRMQQDAHRIPNTVITNEQISVFGAKTLFRFIRFKYSKLKAF
jgi:hypothetical protein